ncbi:MAG: thermonuclease family protein [Planctomycetes bacterium]|nr:thermonuclease family protein [Planctomycetota bacterium]MCB9935313.1 thermonuclease family protein [Planctomycetota bacterium]
MSRTNQSGRISTGRTAALMVALVALIGVVLWSSGYLPFRLRDDGIYAGNAPTPAAGSTTIERPRLYLPAPDKKKAGYYAVTEVIDGDTIEIDRGKGERIRLIGIDTAELGREQVDPDSDGWRATMFLFKLLEQDPQVKLKYDAEREDKYGRTLAYVYLPDGRMLNELLLKEGWAETMRIPPNTRHADEFKQLETEAKASRVGRWR